MTATTTPAGVDKLQTRNGIDFAVADLALHEFGRKEIRLAEHEMPGLMELRREYAEARPLHGARIAGSQGGLDRELPRLGVPSRAHPR